MKITRRNKDDNRLPTVQDGMLSLRDAMDRLFDESFWSPFSLMHGNIAPLVRAMYPRVDVSETDTVVKARVDAPGIDPEKVSIEVTEEMLSISGSVEKSDEEKGENFYRMERQSGQFSREFMLPSRIDVDSVKAEAKNGVITVTMDKLPGEKRTKVSIAKS